MKRLFMFLVIASLMLLAGCKGTQTANTDNWARAALYYSYPMNGQQEVSPDAPVVLAFMGQVTASASNFTLKDDQSNPVAFMLKQVNAGKGFVLTPTQPLSTNTHYTLTASNLVSAQGGAALPTGGLQFTTRPADRGPIADTRSEVAFEVTAMSPDGQTLPFLDFSTITLTLSHPLDAQTVVYGQSVKLMQNGNLVPATVLVSGRYMTIDPTNATGDSSTNHDLLPGVPVTIELTSAIQDKTDSTMLTAYSKTLTPLDTTPRVTMVQQAPAASANGCVDPNALLSPLSGAPINCVPVIAKLLGDTTMSSQSSPGVYAELAFAPHFPDATPLRIKKGALLAGGALQVLIGGQVDAGFNSGPVTVTFLSDANGYLLDNPYTNDPNAPKRLLLTMDVAFDTADPRTNGAFTQNLLHVTLVGTAIANTTTGELVADAIGVVEPNVLGLETGYGVLSFHMASYPDQTHLPVPAQQQPDNRPLDLSSWVPGTLNRPTTNTDGSVIANLGPVNVGDASNVADVMRPGNPIILTFTKPLDVNTITPGTTLLLSLNGSPVPFTWTLDGTSLVMRPNGGLQYSTQDVSGGTITTTHNATYTITYTSGLKDMNGNGEADGGKTLTFTMPLYANVDGNGNSSTGHSPVVTALYPGFPCVTEDADLANGIQGRCVGGTDDANKGTGGHPATTDDLLPLPALPANRSIHVNFSQVMGGITLGQNFLVEQCGSATACTTATPVAGQLNVNGMDLTFTPQTSWQSGALYRYTLKSGSRVSNSQICAQQGAVCSAVTAYASEPHPLMTAMLNAPAYDTGGSDLVIYFTGAPATDNVLQILKQYPVADTDASFNWDVGEPSPGLANGETPNSRVLLNSTMLAVKSVDGTVITGANVGCNVGASCPDNNYLYMTGALDADIVGFKTATEVQQMETANPNLTPFIPAAASANGGVLAYIYPTQIVATSILTVANTLLGTTDLPTGTQLMRIRYVEDASNNPTQPVPGWIVTENGRPVFKTILNVYMDAPYLVITKPVAMDHNMHSYPLSVELSGPVDFLPDGRLRIGQLSQNDLTIDAVDTTLFGVLHPKLSLEVPVGGINLNYVGAPIKQ